MYRVSRQCVLDRMLLFVMTCLLCLHTVVKFYYMHNLSEKFVNFVKLDDD